MTIKLSEPMRNVLMKLWDGWGWDDFGITGPLSYVARLRTCETLAKQLKDQAKAAQAAS
jgi:hypothetical protein